MAYRNSSYRCQPSSPNDRDGWPPRTYHYTDFFLLYRLAPRLHEVFRRSRSGNAVAFPLSDRMFVSLCACFADPTKRGILRALILDLLADDLAELLAAQGGEGF